MFHTEAFMTFEARAAAAALPNKVRHEMIKNLLYRYPKFKDGVAFIESFHRPSVDVHDTGCVGGLLGESRAGKSKICEYYASLYPDAVAGDIETYPVIVLEATEQMTPHHMAQRLFFLTGARSIPNIKVNALMDNSVLRLTSAENQLLIIDDAHLLLCDRPNSQIKAFRGFVKQLLDAKRFNVMLVGEERLRETIFQMATLANRGFYCETVEPMGDSGKEFEMFRLLLDKIDDRLPFLSKSGLEVWAKDFHHFSSGKIGRLMGLVERAGLLAIGLGTGCVMVDELRTAVNRMRAPGDRYPYFERG